MLKGAQMKLFILLLALILITASCSTLANQKCERIDEEKSFMETCMISLAVFTRSHEIPQRLMDFCQMIYQAKLKGQVGLILQSARIPIQSKPKNIIPYNRI